MFNRKGEILMKTERQDETKKKEKKIPIYNLPMMSDEKWNRLAYQNWLERRCLA